MAAQRYDAVIVGSGFGGSVMAYRLAKAGRRVLVLERGRAYGPGDFARSPAELRGNFWDPDAGLYGLVDLWTFRTQVAIVSSGLGGGSLVYANVLKRMPRAWFDAAPWPLPYDAFARYYDEVEAVLGGTPFPERHLARAEKARAFAGAAVLSGLEAERPLLAVTFARDGSSEAECGVPFGDRDPVHGRFRRTCTLCGECDRGCNEGAKNTLDFTYLAAALAEGAELRPLHEAKRIARADGGYEVDVRSHEDRVSRRVAAARVIVSAGALGSTHLLLRSELSLAPFPAGVGGRFCGNGDFITFAARGASRPVDPVAGTVITTSARVEADGERFLLQDGGYGEFLSWVMLTLGMPGTAWRSRRLASRLVAGIVRGTPERNLSAELSRILDESYPGRLPILAMGMDPPNGHLRLAGDGALELDRELAPVRPYYAAVRNRSRTLVRRLGGRFRGNPLWRDRFLARLNQHVTVHPLGGCPLGSAEEGGVVDPATGEVHGNPGLHVADGAVLPGPAGANPSLTIAAVAHHFATGILRD